MMDQLKYHHKWNSEALAIDEELRAAGCIAIVDPLAEGLFIWPVDKCPRVVLLQLGLNKKALGRQYCMDLLAEAGYHPPEDA